MLRGLDGVVVTMADETWPSGVVYKGHPGENMYGCQPCPNPQCRSLFRYTRALVPEVIVCDDCGLHENVDHQFDGVVRVLEALGDASEELITEFIRNGFRRR